MATRRYAIVSLTLPDNELLEVSGRVVNVLRSEQLGNVIHPEGWNLTVLVEEDNPSGI